MNTSCPSCGGEGLVGTVFCPLCGHLLYQADPFVDQVVGKYRLVERIADGGSSVIYHAQHVATEKPSAVKILLPQYADKQEMIGRFRREAQVMSQLHHDNLVAIDDFGSTEQGLYLAMEWPEGETVHSYLLRHGPLPKDLVLYLFTQLFDALHVAHSHGVVHRDLKLENLMLVQEHQGRTILKVLDFGVAHVHHVDTSLTRTGILVGTPKYMAPEQIQAEKGTIDARTDVYACGLMLLELLTGQPAFYKETVSQLLYGQLYEMPPFLHQLHPGGCFGEELEQVVRRAVQKQPDMRFSSVLAFREALLQAMTKQGVALPPIMHVPLQPRQTPAQSPVVDYNSPQPVGWPLSPATPHSASSQDAWPQTPQTPALYGAVPRSPMPYATPSHQASPHCSMPQGWTNSYADPLADYTISGLPKQSAKRKRLSHLMSAKTPPSLSMQGVAEAGSASYPTQPVAFVRADDTDVLTFVATPLSPNIKEDHAYGNQERHHSTPYLQTGLWGPEEPEVTGPARHDAAVTQRANHTPRVNNSEKPMLFAHPKTVWAATSMHISRQEVMDLVAAQERARAQAHGESDESAHRDALSMQPEIQPDVTIDTEQAKAALAPIKMSQKNYVLWGGIMAASVLAVLGWVAFLLR